MVCLRKPSTSQNPRCTQLGLYAHLQQAHKPLFAETTQILPFSFSIRIRDLYLALLNSFIGCLHTRDIILLHCKRIYTGNFGFRSSCFNSVHDPANNVQDLAVIREPYSQWHRRRGGESKLGRGTKKGSGFLIVRESGTQDGKMEGHTFPPHKRNYTICDFSWIFHMVRIAVGAFWASKPVTRAAQTIMPNFESILAIIISSGIKSASRYFSS